MFFLDRHHLFSWLPALLQDSGNNGRLRSVKEHADELDTRMKPSQLKLSDVTMSRWCNRGEFLHMLKLLIDLEVKAEARSMGFYNNYLLTL